MQLDKIGYFDDQSNEFVITNPRQERYQENFLFNKHFFACVMQTGTGYSRLIDPNDDHALHIVHGTRDDEQYEHSRLIYIRDNQTGEFWSVGWEPVCSDYESYECRIGVNYTRITNVTRGIKVQWTIFVPYNDDPVELWQVEVTALRDADLSVYLYTELSLATLLPTYGHDGYLRATYDADLGGVCAVKNAQAMVDRTNAICVFPSVAADSYTCSRANFMGLYSTMANPKALRARQLGRRNASKERFCAAYQYDRTLRKGQPALFEQMILPYNQKDTAYVKQMQAKYSGTFATFFDETRQLLRKRFSAYSIHTGNPNLDRIVNHFSKHQIDYGARHVRWGIKGYRDLAQHSIGILPMDADLARTNLLKLLHHQFSSGFAIRVFPEVHVDAKMAYSDSSCWLIYAITEYLKETGDIGFLDELIPFKDHGSATVYDRLHLIVQSLFNDRGQHGMVRIHDGDWNDSMTHVGKKGIGESVWMTMFLARAIVLLIELNTHLRRPTEQLTTMYETLKSALNKNAWDGQWYVRAFDDHGGKLGSKESKGSRIFVNAQSWAMIAGIADAPRIESIKKSIDQYLQTDFGYLLNFPTYQELDPHIGRLTAMQPGTAENGSAYMHGNAFLAYGLFNAGQSDAAYGILERILPTNPANPSQAICPYIFGNCYYGPDHLTSPGKMEISWITGSTNWIILAILESMLGFNKTYEGLKINPQLPKGISHADVDRIYRGRAYHLSIHNEGGSMMTVLVNGHRIDHRKAIPESLLGQENRIDIHCHSRVDRMIGGPDDGREIRKACLGNGLEIPEKGSIPEKGPGKDSKHIDLAHQR